MKKILLLSAATCVFASAIYAQTETDLAYVKSDIKSIHQEEASIKKEKREAKKELRTLRGNEVSPNAKRQFSQDFGEITGVNWERTKNFDEATFTKDSQVTTAFYDDRSQLVGTTVKKTFADLSARARNFINKEYSDYSVGDVLFYDDNEGNDTDMSLYNQQFDDVDSYFVELTKDNRKIVVQVAMNGDTGYFTRLN